MKIMIWALDISRLAVIEGPVLRDSTFQINSCFSENEVARLPFVRNSPVQGSVPGIGSGHNFSADGIADPGPGRG